LGVGEYILAQLDGSNRTLYRFTITSFVTFYSEHNAGYLIKEFEMDASCDSQSGEEEFMQVFGG
jgi:hypothetical protein